MNNYDVLYKILLIGNSGVGKSSILFRYCDDIYTDLYVSTIGVDFKIKTIVYEGKKYKLQIWDTAGQERFKSITSSYYRGSSGIILVFDVSNIDSFKKLKVWLEETEEYAGRTIPTVIIGNKIDFKHKRVVSYEDGMKFAKNINVKYVETSAKNGSGIQKIFETLICEMDKKLQFNEPQSKLFVENNNNKTKKCCRY